METLIKLNAYTTKLLKDFREKGIIELTELTEQEQKDILKNIDTFNKKLVLEHNR